MNSKSKNNELELNYENEQWKTVNYHPSYEISDLGRCRHTCKNGKVKILKPLHNGAGKTKAEKKKDYQFYILNGHKLYVHFLVLSNFIGKRPLDHESDHINRNRWDNRLENLRWLPRAENRSHKGSQHPNAKLTDRTVILARFVYDQYKDEGITYKSIGEMLKVSPSAISKAVLGKTWGHI